MNQTDATTGYVVDQATIEATPLGTGSFTQLAILSPGVHADFLGGAGSNAGLGNQAIFANGQRDTSNSFSLNGISTNNLFNGNSTSQVGENRFVLNTGESFGAGGEIQTSTSCIQRHRSGSSHSARRGHPGDCRQLRDVRRHAGRQ